VIDMSGVVFAQMWDGDDHMSGGWWWLMGIGWLVFLALVVVLGYLLIRHFTQTSGGGQRHQSAEDVLADRFARGEIDEDEFRRRRDALRG
jgi:putative membrane protein